jgi:transposase
VTTSQKAMAEKFQKMPRCRVAIEVGTHSPWVSRLLTRLGFEVIVANARQVQLISASSRKSDRVDARMLARLARVDPQLLRPIRHRGEQGQTDLMTIRIRASLVEARTGLINAARGFCKALGERLPGCDADSMGVEKMEALPEQMRERLRPLLEEVESLTEQIQKLDTRIEQIARTQYPETKLLQQVHGVETLIALTFVLTVEDRERFQKSRDVGCYVGLRPKQSQSGESQPQLRISKEGDRYLRTLLVQGAHLILNRRGPDTDLKRWGLKLAQRGGKNAKKRAIGAEVGGVAAQVVGMRRGVRAVAPPPCQGASEEGSLSSEVNPTPSSGDCAVAAERAFPATETAQFGTEIAAPVSTRTSNGTGAYGSTYRVRMEAGRIGGWRKRGVQWPAAARNLDAPFPVSPSGGKPGREGSPHAGSTPRASQKRWHASMLPAPPTRGLPPPCGSPAVFPAGKDLTESALSWKP